MLVEPGGSNSTAAGTSTGRGQWCAVQPPPPRHGFCQFIEPSIHRVANNDLYHPGCLHHGRRSRHVLLVRGERGWQLRRRSSAGRSPRNDHWPRPHRRGFALPGHYLTPLTRTPRRPQTYFSVVIRADRTPRRTSTTHHPAAVLGRSLPAQYAGRLEFGEVSLDGPRRPAEPTGQRRGAQRRLRAE